VRLPIFIGLAIGAVAAIIGVQLRAPERVAPAPEQAVTSPQDRADGSDESVSAAAPQSALAAPTLEVPTATEPALVVDSFPPTRHVPLDDWTRSNASAGHFDGVVKEAGRAALAPGEQIGADAVLLASGWSGDPRYGLQFRDVVLTQCDRIIARTRTTLERRDVAGAVHPNLDRSGWQALVHAADLAFCSDPAIRAWAVLPGRPPTLLPLNGAHRIAAVDLGQPVANHVPASPPLVPGDVAPPIVSEIEITAKRVNLRRCGSTSCERIDQIDGGRHRVHIAAQRDGWSLVIFGDRAGWMSDDFYRAAE
jgi:hypothetical protein